MRQHIADPTSMSLTTSLASTTLTSIDLERSEPPSPIQLPDEPERHPHRTISLDPRFLPPTIPDVHKNRTLVLCFDGTGDCFDADNSNIVRFVSLLKKDDQKEQLVYYQSGIGTYTIPPVANPSSSKIKRTLDLMFAWHLNAHVMGGYEYLMQTYTAGDKICLFGFSRGAYTARSLAGMLNKVGLLPAYNIQQVPFAYKMYTDADDFGWEQSEEFKKAFCINVDIEFVGLWDTVDAVGLFPRSLPFTTSNTIVKTFRHALSLDERRAKYKANLWNGYTRPVDPDNPSTQEMASPTSPRPPNKNPRRRATDPYEKLQSRFEQRYGQPERSPTDVEEVWFAGCHCDVGGGSVTNKTRNSLARISLRWMIRECFKTNTGIMFKVDGLKELGLEPLTLFPMFTPRPPPICVSDGIIEEPTPTSQPWIIRFFSNFIKMLSPESPYDNTSESTESTKAQVVGTEEEEDLKDALSPMYDQLKIRPLWWILEILPLKLRYQRGDHSWVSYVGCNMGSPRRIPGQYERGVRIHRSVETRMKARYAGDPSKKYLPAAKLLDGVVLTWVD